MEHSSDESERIRFGFRFASEVSSLNSQMSIKSSLSSTPWPELPNNCLFSQDEVPVLNLLWGLGELPQCFVFAGDFVKGPLRVRGLAGLEVRNGDLLGDLLSGLLLCSLFLHCRQLHFPVTQNYCENIMIMKIFHWTHSTENRIYINNRTL